MTHSDAREGKWRGNWRMKWVANTLHTISEHTDAPPRRFKWNRPFRRKTKSGFCAFAITFQLASIMQLLKFSYTSMCFENAVFSHRDICIFRSKFSLDEIKTITDGVIMCELMWPSSVMFISSWRGVCNFMHSGVGWGCFELTTSVRLWW